MSTLAIHEEQPVDISPITEAEVAKAVQEVQAALVIAKRFPRDEDAALRRVEKACRRRTLAEVALYALPRGNQKITGPSIRLAEALAKSWGNLEFGIQEIDRTEDHTVVEAYCWDLETNVRRRRRLTVEHKIRYRDGKTKIVNDPKEISEMVGSQGQRQVRQCILSVIPGDVVEFALKTCHETLNSDSENLSEKAKKMLKAYSELGVTQQMIEDKYQKPITALSQEDTVELQKIYVSIKEGTTKADEWFGEKATDGTVADDLNSRFAK